MTSEVVPVLTAEQLTVRYGWNIALREVSFEVKDSEAIAVVGPNGSGKSSLARALSGLVRPASGRTLLAGVDATRWSPQRRRRWGISYLPEERGICGSLSVQDNLATAVRLLPRKTERRAAIDRALTTFPALASRRRQRAATLSGGEQQMLSLARGMAVTPRILIADELSLGLAPRIVDEVFASLEDIRRAGIAVILIEQYVSRALHFADRVVVLRNGSLAFDGPASGVTQHELYEKYIGA